MTRLIRVEYSIYESPHTTIKKLNAGVSGVVFSRSGMAPAHTPGFHIRTKSPYSVYPYIHILLEYQSNSNQWEELFGGAQLIVFCSINYELSFFIFIFIFSHISISTSPISSHIPTQPASSSPLQHPALHIAASYVTITLEMDPHSKITIKYCSYMI